MVKEISTQIKDLKTQVIKEIIDFLKSFNLEELDVNDFHSVNPPNIGKLDNSNCDYWLSSLIIENNELLIKTQSIICDTDCVPGDLALEKLAEIYEYLLEYKDAIREYALECQEDEKTVEKQRYVIRFYRRAWTDIVVEAEDEDEACELAKEMYDNGDYDDSDENFENQSCKNVTDSYSKNGIDF